MFHTPLEFRERRFITSWDAENFVVDLMFSRRSTKVTSTNVVVQIVMGSGTQLPLEVLVKISFINWLYIFFQLSQFPQVNQYYQYPLNFLVY